MSAPNHYGLTKQQGLTLIELMIALALGLLLLRILMGIYLSSQQSTHLQAALNQIEHNATIALSIIQTDISRAGQIGCARLSQDFPLVSYPPYSLTVENKLILSGSHQLTVRYADYPANTLLAAMQNDSRLIVSNEVAFKPGEIVVISDCRKAEIFKIEAVSENHGVQIIIPSSSLHYLFQKDAEISRLIVNSYYLAATKRKQINGTPIYALFRDSLNQQHEELVEGIDEMNFQAEPHGIAIKLNVSALAFKKDWYGYALLPKS